MPRLASSARARAKISASILSLPADDGRKQVGITARWAASMALSRIASRTSPPTSNFSGPMAGPSQARISSAATPRLYRLPQDTGSKATPARVRSSHNSTATVTEQHRQTVRGHYHAHLSRFSRDRRIGSKRLRRLLQQQHPGPMHLFQPYGFTANCQDLCQQSAIGRHCRRIITHMRTKIEFIPGRRTDSTTPRTHRASHPRRCRPGGNQEWGTGIRHVRDHLPCGDSASSVSSSATISSGRGDSQRNRSPVVG